jgi:hypothetical protein
LCFAVLSVAGRPVLAQSPPVPQTLRIVVAEDEENLRQPPTVREPVVRVEDEKNRPVAGAVVVFTASANSGEFMNGARSLVVTTDQQGRAKAAGFRPNSQNEEFALQVVASFQELRAETVIRETNVTAVALAKDEPAVEPVTHGHTSRWIIIGGVVAAGAIGAALAGRGSSGGSTPSGVTITPGTGTVAAPHK